MNQLNSHDVVQNSSIPGGTPLYKPCRCVPPQGVGFFPRFGLKTGIHFVRFGLESGIVFERSKRPTSLHVNVVAYGRWSSTGKTQTELINVITERFVCAR